MSTEPTDFRHSSSIKLITVTLNRSDKIIKKNYQKKPASSLSLLQLYIQESYVLFNFPLYILTLGYAFTSRSSIWPRVLDLFSSIYTHYIIIYNVERGISSGRKTVHDNNNTRFSGSTARTHGPGLDRYNHCKTTKMIHNKRMCN